MLVNEKQPTVSVIIPTYNRKKLLQRAVNSALAQTQTDIEIIVVDDGSTDGTAELFTHTEDARVQYHLLPHHGACAARNTGISLANGRYIAFLDSDDVWRPDKLAKQQRQLESSGADVVFCAFRRHDGTRVVRYPEADVPEGLISYQQLLSGNLVSTQTIFGRADCMKRVLFDENFPRMQDWEYAIRLAATSKLFYFSDVLAELYVQPDSISRKPELGLKAMRLLLQKYRRDFANSLPNTLLMLGTMETFADQCGGKCAVDYLKALSAKRHWRDNAFLFRRSVVLLLRNALLHITRRDVL